MAFAAPPKRGGRFRGRQEENKLPVITMANYMELIPTLDICDVRTYDIDRNLTEEETKTMDAALEEAGFNDCFKPAEDEANNTNEERRRAGQGRPLMGSNRRANPRRRFQVRRQ